MKDGTVLTIGELVDKIDGRLNTLEIGDKLTLKCLEDLEERLEVLEQEKKNDCSSDVINSHNTSIGVFRGKIEALEHMVYPTKTAKDCQPHGRYQALMDLADRIYENDGLTHSLRKAANEAKMDVIGISTTPHGKYQKLIDVVRGFIRLSPTSTLQDMDEALKELEVK